MLLSMLDVPKGSLLTGDRIRDNTGKPVKQPVNLIQGWGSLGRWDTSGRARERNREPEDSSLAKNVR